MRTAKTLLELRDILNSMPEHRLLGHIELLTPDREDTFHVEHIGVGSAYADTILDLAYEPIHDDGARQQDANFGGVNINTASAAELAKLPGIGESSATKIIEGRSRGAYNHKIDITRVPGIGKGMYRMIKDLITT